MNHGEQRPYTPIVLRTGFMHSYRRTFSLLLVIIILEAALWTLAGFWPYISELGPVRWGLIIILILVVPIGTKTIRDIFEGYENLFNVFDEQTDANLKLYQNMDRPSSKTQMGMQELFKDKESYTAFQEWARRIVFDKTTELTTILTLIIVIIIVLYNSIFYEKVILGGTISRYPLWILEISIDALLIIFITLALSFIFLHGIEYFLTISRLGASQRNLSVWSYIQYLRGAPVTDHSVMTYWQFHDYTSNIGRHFSGVAFRIVLLGVVGGLIQIPYGSNIPRNLTWILASAPIVLSILILVLPLNSLHRVMHDAKVAVLRELEKEYDQLTVQFISHLSEQRHIGTIEQEMKNDENLAGKITALKGIIEETKQQWTWPVRPPMIGRIIAASVIPIIYFFIEEYLRVIGVL